MSRYFGTIRQLGYVVDDVDVAIRHYTEVLGIGPFFRVDRVRAPDFCYRGVPTAAELRIALGNSGDMQIELVQPLDREPTMFRDCIDAGFRGLQHVAYWFDTPAKMDAALAQAASLGYEGAQTGTFGENGRSVLLDVARGYPGTVIELSEVGEWKAEVFRMVAAAARDWDGSDPVRTLQRPR
jgi:catechol 2,3-dioxygenase-like lactoylglutathione lyase family enzyme